MQILYVDESGCTGRLPLDSDRIQPLLCIVGIVLPQPEVDSFTRAWINLKRRFFPDLLPPRARLLDWQLVEVKGSELRKAIRSESRRSRRHAFGFLDHSIDILREHNARVIARLWIKTPGAAFNGRSTYTFSVQAMCRCFHRYLQQIDDHGLVIADSRLPDPNSQVSHSIFTQKLKQDGDAFPRILEPPVFGHSDNHAGLQMTDILASAFFFPAFGQFCFAGRVLSIHLHPQYELIARRYASAIQEMQLCIGSGAEIERGIVVSNSFTRRGAKHFFDRFAPV